MPLTITPKEVMQTSRRTGVLIEPLEPDDSVEELPLKRRMHGRYQLQFVNKACEAYYTGEQIKADDGNLLKVALFDENNTKITSGPLSSASVEVVVLHGDFNAEGYWISEDLSRNIVHPGIENVGTVLGGDSILVLANGEACLGNSFFQITSVRARTGKFKMGVMMASAQDERIQEGISESFLVKNHLTKDLPLGFRFHPTDEELIVHYLCHRAAAAHNIMAEVDVFKFVPWDLPSKALFGEDEWYFLCPWNPRYTHDDHAVGSGYWKATGTDEPITTGPKVLGFKKALVFYEGHAPDGVERSWKMHQYHLAKTAYGPTVDSTEASSSTSSMNCCMQLDEWVLCKIYKQPKQQFPDLPKGCRFQPTDGELILHYLRNRAASMPCPTPFIADVDIHKFEPWDLPSKAAYGDKEWYFFNLRDRKYATGTRTNRATTAGYWKATGKDREVYDKKRLIGMKKALVFYQGRAPRGEKTGWVMHEYRLESYGSFYQREMDDWVLCRIFKKTLMAPPIADYNGLDHDEQSGVGFNDSCSFDDISSFDAPTSSGTTTCSAMTTHPQASRLPKNPSISDLLFHDTAEPYLATGDTSAPSESELMCSSYQAAGTLGTAKRKASPDDCVDGTGVNFGQPPAKRLNGLCFDAQEPASDRNETAESVLTK